MPRDTARLLAESPNLVHVDVQRDDAGAVASTAETSSTGTVTGATTTETVFSHTIRDPNLVAFTTASITVSPTGTGTGTAQLNRDGASILNTAATNGGTSSTNQTGVTHTTPLNAPVYSLVVTATGTEDVNWSVSLSREQRWAG